MIIAVALLLTVLTFAFIIYPLLKQKSRSVGLVEGEELQELHSKRDTTYSMLKELEFDLKSGVLTDEDYRNLEANYKKKAVSILKDIDNVERGSDVKKEIETQILELRRGKGRFCSQCGVRYQDGDRFCSHCGANLSQRGRVD